MTEPLIRIENLQTFFFTDEGVARAVDDVSLVIPQGRTLGLVGESGCGKSVTALSIMRLISPPGKIVGGRVVLHQNGHLLELTEMAEPDMRKIRGGEISMIFQEPMTSLNPVFTIGSQIMEAIRLHQHVDETEARRRAVEMLRKVQIPVPRWAYNDFLKWLAKARRRAVQRLHKVQISVPRWADNDFLKWLAHSLPRWLLWPLKGVVKRLFFRQARFDDYPHQFSGGMRQRAMMAMALSCNPRLLIADEPTTALDVTIQAQILDLLRGLQADVGLSILIITHDLGIIAETADDVAVMYASKVVEYAPIKELFENTLHPYTHGLFRSRPGLGKAKSEKLSTIPGMVPSPLRFPKGCKFHPRCPFRQAICETQEPELREIRPEHQVRCHFAGELKYE